MEIPQIVQPVVAAGCRRRGYGSATPVGPARVGHACLDFGGGAGIADRIRCGKITLPARDGRCVSSQYRKRGDGVEPPVGHEACVDSSPGSSRLPTGGARARGGPGAFRFPTRREGCHARIEAAMERGAWMGKLYDALLVEGARVFGDVSRRGGCADDVRQTRSVLIVGEASDPVAQQRNHSAETRTYGRLDNDS